MTTPVAAVFPRVMGVLSDGTPPFFPNKVCDLNAAIPLYGWDLKVLDAQAQGIGGYVGACLIETNDSCPQIGALKFQTPSGVIFVAFPGTGGHTATDRSVAVYKGNGVQSDDIDAVLDQLIGIVRKLI